MREYKHWSSYKRIKKAARKIGIEMIPLVDGFTCLSKNIEHDKALEREGWEICRQKMLSGNYDLIVLEEMTYVLMLKRKKELSSSMKPRKQQTRERWALEAGTAVLVALGFDMLGEPPAS